MDLSTYLEGLLQKSSIPESELKHFLNEMRKTPSGPLITSKLLASKIQSASETQAMRAFDLLEAALNLEGEGSIEFRTEIGRYRFLNELIRILSPKFYGAQTLPAVKQRAIKFLTEAAGSKRRQWFPSEHSKIDAVYSSLVDGGIIVQPNAVDPDAEFQKSIFERSENAVILKKLLQSKDPADLQAANRLIKNLVDEEAKRNERRSEIHSLIDQIETSTTLLTEMCRQFQIDREIVDDLADSCRSLRNKLSKIGTETNEETSTFLQASDNIEKALIYYESRKNEVIDPQVLKSSNLIESPETTMVANLSLADELLMGMELEPVNTSKSRNIIKNDICREDGASNLNLLHFDYPDQVAKSSEVTLNTIDTKRKGGMNDLDLISRQLMEESLGGQDVGKKFTSEVRSTTLKVTLSQLQKQSMSTTNIQSPPINSLDTSIPSTSTPPTHISLLDLDFLEKPTNAMDTSSNGAHSHTSEDDKILLLHDNSSEERRKWNRFTDSDCNFNLNSIKDLDLENICMLEDIAPLVIPLKSESATGNGLIEVNFTFGTLPDFPPSVKVSVISVANRNSALCLSDYSFQLLPPKGFQVKLFPPSSTELEPWKKRFLSPPLLTQVALILVPSQGKGKEIKIKFILSCYIGEETALFNSEFVLPYV